MRERGNGGIGGSHIGAQLVRHLRHDESGAMPSLFRFLFVVAVLAGCVMGSLHVLATYFEPAQTEVTKRVYARVRQ